MRAGNQSRAQSLFNAVVFQFETNFKTQNGRGGGITFVLILTTIINVMGENNYSAVFIVSGMCRCRKQS